MNPTVLRALIKAEVRLGFAKYAAEKSRMGYSSLFEPAEQEANELYDLILQETMLARRSDDDK